MADIPVERYRDVVGAFERLGSAWWLWILLGQATVTYGNVLLIVIVPLRLALGAYVVLALLRVAAVLPGAQARQLRGLAFMAGLATLVNVSGAALGAWSIAASTAYVAVALVGLTQFARTMRSFTTHEPRAVTVADTWHRAVRWGSVAVAAFAVGCLSALIALGLASGAHATRTERDLVVAIGAVLTIPGIGLLLSVARGTRWTRMAFEEGPDTIWHGSVIEGPRSPAT